MCILMAVPGDVYKIRKVSSYHHGFMHIRSWSNAKKPDF